MLLPWEKIIKKKKYENSMSSIRKYLLHLFKIYGLRNIWTKKTINKCTHSKVPCILYSVVKIQTRSKRLKRHIVIGAYSRILRCRPYAS